MTTKAESMIRHDGILAVVVVTPDISENLGDPKLVTMAQMTLEMFSKTYENEIRVVWGGHTCSAVRTTTGMVAISVATGHPVVKSAKRMMRRMLRALAKSPALAK